MIYDISPPVSSLTPVWTGEPSLRQEFIAEIKKGDSVSVSILHSPVHIGAHADAPLHILADADSIDKVDLDSYIGKCQVIEIECKANEIITPNHLTQPILAERILLKTLSFYGSGHWVDDFAVLSPELVSYLHAKEVKLVGIDTPSVDAFSSKTLDSHKLLVANKIAILEGLDLTEIPPGIYELIALPLKLVGFDASPVRAILRTI